MLVRLTCSSTHSRSFTTAALINSADLDSSLTSHFRDRKPATSSQLSYQPVNIFLPKIYIYELKNINQECWFSSASCQQHSPVFSWKWFLKSIQQFFWSSQLCKCQNIWRIVTRKYFYFSVLLEYQDNCLPLDMWRWWMFGWSSLSPTPSSSLPATASRKLVAIREKLWWTVKVVSNIYLNSFNFETQQPPTRDLSSDCVWCQLQTHLKTILCSISYKSFTVNCLQSTTKNNPALKA